MTIQEAWNRGNNLVATAIVALAGFSFLPETFLEEEHIFKIDDALLFWLGIGTLVWYLWKNNKFRHSIWPVVFVWMGLAIKLVGVILEFKEKDDVGDDFGGLILFVLASILVTWIFIKSKKLLSK